MKIFSAEQIRLWDAYTITNEPVNAIDLMERAASACFCWLHNYFKKPNAYLIFCGTGNNGADGLAIARMLLLAGDNVSICILDGEKRSVDFNTNFARIAALTTQIHFIDSTHFPVITKEAILIDALFGSGLNRPIMGDAADLVTLINDLSNTIISIDMPSGLIADAATEGEAIIRASFTVSFQINKLAFMMPGNHAYTGILHLLDIGLHPQFYENEPTQFNTIDLQTIIGLYKPRDQFSHKYNFGHALLYAGSKNMMGAGILCAKACLRSGAGLATVFTEESTERVIQATLPEAITTGEKDIGALWQKKSVIGIGPGLIASADNDQLLTRILTSYDGPLVIDATGLQLLAKKLNMLQKRVSNPAVLTPHSGEFEKLFGKANSDFDRLTIARQQSAEQRCYIILKGHYTIVACPDGDVFFNTTGNAGMATAGSGDVLTGMLTGLLAQGYSQKNACLLGVYLHGMAGDIAADQLSQEAMLAGDMIDFIGAAYKKISASIP